MFDPFVRRAGPACRATAPVVPWPAHSAIPPVLHMLPWHSPHPTCVLTHHGRVRFAREGLPELRHVRDRPVDTVLVRRVQVGRRFQPLGFGPRVLAPELREPEKQTLL